MGAFAAVLLTAAVVAQAAPASPPATSLIAGRVVDGLSNRPVAGAIVSLSGAGLGTTPRAMTNANEGQMAQARTAAGQVVSGIAKAGGILEINY